MLVGLAVSMYPAFVGVSLLLAACAAAAAPALQSLGPGRPLGALVGGGQDGGLRFGESKNGLQTDQVAHQDPQIYFEDALHARSPQLGEAIPPRAYSGAKSPPPPEAAARNPPPILRSDESRTNPRQVEEEEDERDDQEGAEDQSPSKKAHPTYLLTQVLLDNTQHALVLQKSTPQPGTYYPEGSLWSIYSPPDPSSAYAFHSTGIVLSSPRISRARRLGVLYHKEAGMRGIARRFELLPPGTTPAEDATWHWLDSVLRRAHERAFLTLDPNVRWERTALERKKRGLRTRGSERGRYEPPPLPEAELLLVRLADAAPALLVSPREAGAAAMIYGVGLVGGKRGAVYEHRIGLAREQMLALGSAPVLLGRIYDLGKFDEAVRAWPLPPARGEGGAGAWVAGVLAGTHAVLWEEEAKARGKYGFAAR
ncbi:MAG: hypothetical protein M1829_006297 [Trizodia sp. TS-e1964]|nr:MAG: hypothetical protein M1829_006297 [Trizodia sp. TS-e1964]